MSGHHFLTKSWQDRCIQCNKSLCWITSQHDWLCIMVAVEEKPGREAIVTDSEKVADQMVKDILGGKINRTGRQTVRRALDTKDAPPTGRAATDGALGRISRRGGF